MIEVPRTIRDAIWRSIATADWDLYLETFRQAPDNETRKAYAAIRDKGKQTPLQRLIDRREKTPEVQWGRLHEAIALTQSFTEQLALNPTRIGTVLKFPRRKSNPFRLVD
jgi:phosphatidylserine/phosphatidylglycerophosphate/cardiolipin synthase-like enzyme